MNADTLTVLEVLDGGVLVEPGFQPPKVRSEVFGRVRVDRIYSCEDLISWVEVCEPLAYYFRRLGGQHLRELTGPEAFIRRLVQGPSPRDAIERDIVEILRRDDMYGWHGWVRCEGEEGLSGFIQRVKDWMAQPIDWADIAEFDVDATNVQEAAVACLLEVPWTHLDALGVRLLEHDPPPRGNLRLNGYYRAELIRPIDEANAMAVQLGLTCRFRSDLNRATQLNHG